MTKISTIKLKVWIPVITLLLYSLLLTAELYSSYQKTINTIDADAKEGIKSLLFKTGHYVSYAAANGSSVDLKRIVANLTLLENVDEALVVGPDLRIHYSSRLAWIDENAQGLLSQNELNLLTSFSNAKAIDVIRQANYVYGLAAVELSFDGIQAENDEILLLRYDLTEKLNRAFKASLDEALPLIFITLFTALLITYLLHRYVTIPLGLLSNLVSKINSPTEKLENPLLGEDELANVGEALTNAGLQIREDMTALKDRENRISITLNAIGDGVIVTDSEGYIQRLNPTAEKLTGWTAEQAIGELSQHVFKAFSHERSELVDPVQEVIHTGKELKLHNRTILTSKANTKLQISQCAAPIYEGDKLVGVVLVFQDVSREYMLRDKLRQSVDFLEKLLQISPSVTFVLKKTSPQTDYVFSYVSESIARYTGISSEQCIAQSHDTLDLIHSDDREKLKNCLNDAINKPGKVITTDFRFIIDAPKNLTFRVNLVATHEIDNTSQIVGVAIDISEQIRHEEQNLFLGNILERSLNEIYIFDAQTLLFIQVNYGALNNLGYTNEEIKQLTPLDIKHDLSRAQFESLIEPLQSGEKNLVEFETAHYRKDGSSYPVHVSLQKDLSSEGDVFVAFTNDITEAKRSESKINFLAFHDVLTALPNQSLLDERINQAIISSHRDKEQFALLYMDLDRFKIINDTLGHASGDKLLKAVALRLKANVREQDTVSRTGGDEFTVLLVDTDQKGAARVADNLLTAIAQPFVINKQTFHVTTSIGISMYPENGETGPLLKQKADNAMYRAKEHKRNCFQFFTEEMHRKMLHRMHVESELHAAIENNEFSLVYQPQLDLLTNKIIGAEALLRWDNSNLGQVPPNVFIPIAEESGLISEIGDWVLNEAIAQAGRWRPQIPEPFTVAINISGFQFRNSLLADSISTLLREHGLESGDIEIEVTETVAMHDMAYSIKQMQTLRNAGIHLSLDDFGTGFSSLSALKKFPINKLKIDKSFIDDMLIDDDDSAIVDTVITLAKTLKLKTVAEGVESDSQLKMLRSKGCHSIQGYLFSKPVPGDEMLKFSKEYGS